MPSYARFILEGEVRYGEVVESRESRHLMLLSSDPMKGSADRTGTSVRIGDVQLLTPVSPGTIVAVGRNYADHTAEMGLEQPVSPRIFFKPPSAVIGPGEPIRYPSQSHDVEHEAELAVVIGRTARGLTQQNALDHVFGYCCANDVTARDIQRADGQPSWAKAFDTFCPIGPWIATDPNPDHLEVRCTVNGQLRQRASTATMLYSVANLLAYISSVMTLRPRDIVLTGTPAGVGPLTPGDVVSVEISGIGELSNPVERGGDQGRQNEEVH